MVNYPHQISRKIAQVRTKKSNRVDFANRGMNFESAINATNDYYLSRGLAVIHKKPTPVQIVKVDYPKRSRAKIVEAYFRQASTTDYSGVYKGYYIDFEAKETRQIKHMSQVINQDGICFVLLHFSTLKETYLLPAKDLIAFYQIDKGTKSMPLDYIKKRGYAIAESAYPQVPYLEIIEKLLGGNT